jgi:hypothetical protein
VNTLPGEKSNTIAEAPIVDFVSDVTNAAVSLWIAAQSKYRMETPDDMQRDLRVTAAFDGLSSGDELSRAALLEHVQSIGMLEEHVKSMEMLMKQRGFPLDLCTIQAVATHPRLALYYALSDPWACTLRAVKAIQPDDEICFDYGPDHFVYRSGLVARISDSDSSGVGGSEVPEEGDGVRPDACGENVDKRAGESAHFDARVRDRGGQRNDRRGCKRPYTPSVVEASNRPPIHVRLRARAPTQQPD